MNTTRCKPLATLLALGLAAGLASAAKTITSTGNMAFGRIAAGTGGTVTVGLQGARSRTGGVVLLSSPAAAASFAIGGRGNDNRIHILTLPANGVVSLVAGTDRMAVNNFTSSYPTNGALVTGNLTVTVGATLSVAPNQRPASYSGTFPVTLEFQ